jgi:peptidoglycan/xylan/chitin deacetylase (PgdA/CDA1 family)
VTHFDKAGFAAAALAVAAGVAYATVSHESQIFGRVVVAGDDPDEIALTFDDGPNPAATPRLLEVLARHEVRATFFLIGDFVRMEPGLVREIVAAGHAVGSHTMTHPRLPFLSEPRMREEIGGAKAAIEDATGARVTLFRPPYGQRRPAVMRIARELGMATVMWNVMVGDWRNVPAQTLVERMNAKVERNHARGTGSNIVLHDGGQAGLNQGRMATVEATDRLLRMYPWARYVGPELWGA